MDFFFQAKLSIMLVTLVVAVLLYLWMEHKVARLTPHRLPKIPKPRHKVRGYRYLEEDSDETGSEREEGEEEAEEPNREQEQPRCRNRHGVEQAIAEGRGDN